MKLLARLLMVAWLLAPAWMAQARAEGAHLTSNSYNPALSLILDGRFTRFDRDPALYALPGFQRSPDSTLGNEGLGIGESELTASANIDDQFFGSLTASLAPEGGASVEEAFIETLDLGHGLVVKAGRFLSSVGYLNEHHRHAWDFADAPLIYRGLFGDQLRDDGLSVAWVAPTDLFLRIGGEWLSGARFPAGGAAHGGTGASALILETGGDIGVEQSWQVGLSWWNAQVPGRSSAPDDPAALIFNGDSRIAGLDFVWKWAPDGNPTSRNLKLQGEWFQRDESGIVTNGGAAGSYDGRQGGGYLQLVYQFMPRWRAGLRYDRIEADNRGSDTALLAAANLRSSGALERESAMLDFSNSEFSRLRAQYNRDSSQPGTDHQVIVHYVVSLGAHGAHKF